MRKQRNENENKHENEHMKMSADQFLCMIGQELIITSWQIWPPDIITNCESESGKKNLCLKIFRHDDEFELGEPIEKSTRDLKLNWMMRVIFFCIFLSP